MNNNANALDALKFISDWAKWLVTLETASIAFIGSLFTSDKISLANLSNVFGTTAIICFLISIVAAAILLLTLPEVAQYLRDDTNIWMTADSVAGNLFHLNTQTLAVMESFFFGVGMIFSSALIITVIWR